MHICSLVPLHILFYSVFPRTVYLLINPGAQFKKFFYNTDENSNYLTVYRKNKRLNFSYQ